MWLRWCGFKLEPSLINFKRGRALQVFGHHPVRNNHLPFNTPELVEHLEPVLQSRVRKLTVSQFFQVRVTSMTTRR